MLRSQEESGGRKGRSPRQMRKLWIIAVVSLVVVALAAAAAFAAAFAVDSTSFRMVRSQTAVANNCLQDARAHVDISTTATDQQIMDVTVNHAPKNTEFELFVTQQANAPFGISWYQSDFDTNNKGHGEVRARGIFSEELFAVAPGSVNAPQVDRTTSRRSMVTTVRASRRLAPATSAPCTAPCTKSSSHRVLAKGEVRGDARSYGVPSTLAITSFSGVPGANALYTEVPRRGVLED